MGVLAALSPNQARHDPAALSLLRSPRAGLHAATRDGPAAGGGGATRCGMQPIRGGPADEAVGSRIADVLAREHLDRAADAAAGGTRGDGARDREPAAPSRRSCRRTAADRRAETARGCRLP